ncbi:Leucine-rich repeat - like 10 [Theobroma cacao]|nr:Leucine-rich repeat - like 10 [Theobroma cacao]
MFCWLFFQELVDVRPTEPTVGLEPTLDKVWRLLEENNVGIIGLHGSGGVGKTTLLTQINNKLSNNLIGYDVVIWVVVSKDHTIEKVQEKIGEKLGLSNELWKTESCDKKATDIFRKLSKKKFVLLLDDVWERVDLTKVGIPAPNQGNSFKLIFTTRFLEVCGEMGAHEKIKVECLSKDEAWKLFEKKVGEKTLDSHPDIRGLAKQVAAKCGGLPLALITIGRAMACKTIPHDWKYAIEVLKESPHKLAKMDQQVYSLLKFTYDSLPNDLMRSCLLYCSLYPEDYKIGVIWLIDYWFCEGFLDEFDNISRARMQGYSIINFLCNACLLERCEDAIFVKMHDVIRDMALWIARECEAPEKKFLVRGRVKLNTTYDVENWKGVRMSLSCSGIEYLRGTPRCPNLQTLFLNQNNLMMISDGLFQFMRNLRVLSLYANFSLCELPKGISNLVSLECLNLSHTGIMELSIELNSYNFGKQVTRKLAEIVDLSNQGEFERVVENELAPHVDVRPIEPTVGLEPTLVKVWRLLEENNVGIIGLHGLGGVGKTTLLTLINNKLSNNLIGYDVVIWVVVSTDHTIERVQEKIGEKVGLSIELWKNKSCDEKAIDIFRVLSKKKFVLLLDDMWEWVDLIKVGIPVPNQDNGSKLIFTTRSLQVCGEMGAREKIKIECLSKDEAWKLFEEKVGEETLDSHLDI